MTGLRNYLEELPLDEKNHLLNISKTQGRQIREIFKERYREIERQGLEAQKKKQEDLVKRKERLYKKREKQTSEIIYYGLWQNNTTMEQMLQSISKVSEKRKALVAQLRFRSNVLKQVLKDISIFYFIFFLL